MSQVTRPISNSFITEQQSSIGLRVLRKFDIFAFLPVPKDDPVSTRPSLIGTALFFAIFFAYIIYDFVKFVNNNPPILQSYRTPLDDSYYTLPNFAVAYMQNNPYYNKTSYYDNFLNVSWNTKAKTQGNEYNVPVDMGMVTYIDGKQQNFNLIPWMNDKTKIFYQILRTPTQPLKARGLLYTTDIAVYPSIKFNFCVNNATITCVTSTDKNSLTDFGRMFLFIQQFKDNSAISKDTVDSNGNQYLLHNFFLVQGYYKRITINFQVVRTVVLPDYFLRWTTETTQYLQLDSIEEQLSKVNSTVNNPDALAFNMQLSPDILNNRVTFSTLIDHVSLWGAFWGVLFAIFALFFLSYNRKKFYKKNPEWDKFNLK